jgi:Phosphomannose isomerase
MSFMFNPCRYDDPNAINRIEVEAAVADSVQCGALRVGSALAEEARRAIAERGTCSIAIDGYPGAELGVLLNLVEQFLRQAGIPVEALDARELYKSSGELEALLSDCLPADIETDPVLLYGKLYEGGYEGLMDHARLEAAARRLEAFREGGSGVLVVCGYGSLVERLRPLADLRCWMDLSPKRAVLNIREGRYVNVGDLVARHHKQIMRRCYYVDFECAQRLRREILAEGSLDWYVSSDGPEGLTLVPYASLAAIFQELAARPLRCRPVYLKGVWGGHYLTRLRGLPESIDNCAWCFDFIPMEVSLVAQFGDRRLEIPFYTLLQAEGRAIMGGACFEAFKGYFPIRFNYDDTWHSSGNMSIQVHPGEAYVVANNNELGRQDESYYVVEAGQDAKTFLGFKDGADVDRFVSDILRSEKEHIPVDYESYVNAVPSKPGLQVMIPAGTIHASGRNQLVLEIGSLTVGSYTYKMYDYLRQDLDGSLRPIHSRHGAKVLRRERDATWVSQNIVQEPRVIREGEGFVERTVGQHELLYFCLRTVSFASGYPDDTKGQFHVLTLVNGERARVESIEDPARCYELAYLDIVLVPASLGPYRVLNLGNQPATIHKTLLKEGFERGGRA